MKFLLLIPVFFALASCKDDPEPPDKVQLISHSMNPYIFDVGSHWIYIDSISGLLDSMGIFGVLEREHFHGSSHGHALMQEFVMKYNHFFGQDWRWQLISGNAIFLDKIPDGPLLYASNDQVGASFGVHTCIARDSSVWVLGKEYHNTTINKWDDYEGQQNGDFKVLHFHDSIGVIRCEEYKDSQLIKRWDLQRYSVRLKVL